MSEQRGPFASSAAAAGGGAAGQPTSSGDGSDGQSADGSGQHPPASSFSLHLAAANIADATMSALDSGSAAAVSSPTAAAANSETTAAAAAQPSLQPLAPGQPLGQPRQLADNSMTLDKVIEAMAAVPSQPADEFVQSQLDLIYRLGELIDRSAGPTWWRAASILPLSQAFVAIALRVEAVGESADILVSGRSRGSGGRSAAQRDAAAAALPGLTPLGLTRLSLCPQIWACAKLCGFLADDRAPHLSALVSAALGGLLQPVHSPTQRSAVAVLGCMLQNCSGKKKKAMRLAGFVDAVIH